MSNTLNRLRHHAVVGRDDEHYDVCNIRTPSPHLTKCCVARRVDERNLLAAVFDLVGTNVLSDPASFGVNDVRLTNLVQQRGLAMVDMPEDRHDRWSLLQHVFRLFHFENRRQHLV